MILSVSRHPRWSRQVNCLSLSPTFLPKNVANVHKPYQENPSLSIVTRGLSLSSLEPISFPVFEPITSHLSVSWTIFALPCKMCTVMKWYVFQKVWKHWQFYNLYICDVYYKTFYSVNSRLHTNKALDLISFRRICNNQKWRCQSYKTSFGVNLLSHFISKIVTEQRKKSYCISLCIVHTF